jgi:DNA-binding NarL/FixJ family response regulator
MPGRILIADDNPAVRTALRQLLSAKDREIVEAGDGVDAVAKAIESPPDVAVLDLAMPAMDGLAVARELSRRLPNTALVMCTMHWSSHLQVEALKFGVKKVISKAEGGLLVTTVEELLAASRADEQKPPESLPTGPQAIPPPPLINSSETPVKGDALPAGDVQAHIAPPKTPD